MNVRKTATLAMLVSAALIIFISEAQLPPLAPIPGIKIGLANIITLITLLYYGRREAFAVLMLRIILGCIYAGGLSGFVYSFAGGALCFAAEAAALCFINKKQVWVISVIGAVFHNFGQMAAALIITGTPELLWYMPPLIISAVITGTFNGICTRLVYKHMFFNKKGLPH